MNIRIICNGKAAIITDGETRRLFSYDILIMSDNGGALCRHWAGWTATTGKHIREFCGLNKAQYNALELVEVTR